MYKRSAKIKNDKGEYVRAKVLQGDKIKANIQGSEKPVHKQTSNQNNLTPPPPPPPPPHTHTHTISHTMYT